MEQAGAVDVGTALGKHCTHLASTLELEDIFTEKYFRSLY